MSIALSILVISHNQREFISRCLDSILRQKLSVSYEVIVSDDRSTDGTWEIIEDYVRRYPGIVKGVHCNSDECNPINRSERCGWNKATAYRHSVGEYFVNIDADDYLKSDDIYQQQINALMAHPDCSMCQQRVWQVDENAPLDNGFAWPSDGWLTTGLILSPEQVIKDNLRGLNQTYMIRRNNQVDPTLIYGKLYDDSVITLHHLQYGNVIFVDRADYVWVQYKGSISNSVRGIEQQVESSLLPLFHALEIPKFEGLFLSKINIELYRLLKRSIFRNIKMSEEASRYWGQFNGFIFQYVSGQKTGMLTHIRLLFSFLIAKQIRKRGASDRTKHILYRLLLG